MAALNRQLFRLGVRPVRRVDCAVIVVGNVVAGGAGKTPTVIALAQHLQAQGLQVGVISRGYGRVDATTRQVLPGSDPALCGDEPLLIARATGAPVFVARRRIDAARALLVAHPATQIILCDDGLQHFALYRDVELCVFDDRGIGNGWLLPSGPLREAWPRQCLAVSGQSEARTLVLHTGATPAFSGWRAYRTLADYAVRQDGSRVALNGLSRTHPILALAGIAQPDSFFNALRQKKLTLAHTMALPDHYDFNNIDLAPWVDHQLICTEKDAVKLWKRAPEALAVPLEQTMDSGLFSQLDDILKQRAVTQLSSDNGHQTA